MVHRDPHNVPDFSGEAANYEMRFASLFHAGRALSFPCDAQGGVRLDTLSERARAAYRRALQLVGSEYALPVVWLSDASALP